jgi:uncharacterized phage protein (TIGR01671 family)
MNETKINSRFTVRLWDKAISEMLYTVKVSSKCCSIPVVIAETGGSLIEYSGELLKDITLMQGTGLFDKNEVPIFEEDIIQTDIGLMLIKYCESCKQFQPHIMIDGDIECLACNCNMYWSELFNEELEVIGNSFENSELLELLG